MQHTRPLLLLSLAILTSSLFHLSAISALKVKPQPYLNTQYHTTGRCPVTRPTRFTPPAPFPATTGPKQFWFGTNALWTLLPINGEWSMLPQSPSGYTQKMGWFSERYNWKMDPRPAFTIVGNRIDGPAPPLTITAINGIHTERYPSSIAVRLNIPSGGCWRITAKYREQRVTVVVQVRAAH